MNLSKFKLGCLISLGFIAVLLVAPFAMWSVPVGTSPQGNTVIVGDYVSVLSGMFFGGHQERESGSQDKINRQIFDVMTPGVTRLATVQDYLDPDALVSSSYINGVSTKAYVIRNSDGSSVSLIFQDGVLASKDQNGL